VPALRHSDRLRRLERVRQPVEKHLGVSTLQGLARGWRLLYPKLRALQKQQVDPLQDWYDSWSVEFAEMLLAALEGAAATLSETETAFWAGYAAGGSQLVLDPHEIVTAYNQSIGAKIGVNGRGYQIAETTRDRVREAVSAWHADPDMTIADLSDSLSQWFAPSRAQLIARNEVTALSSATTRTLMDKLGVGRWTWQTRLEFNVCDICRPLHGKVFTVNDPMPPDASHIGCMCMAAPLIEGAPEPLGL